MVDESHAAGIFGPRGAGLVSELGLQDEVDVIVRTAKDVDPRRPIVALAAARGWGLLEMRPVRMDLETLFVRLLTSDTNDETNLHAV